MSVELVAQRPTSGTPRRYEFPPFERSGGDCVEGGFGGGDRDQ